MSLEYTAGDELGDAGLFWEDGYGNLIDFTAGWTFVAKVYSGAGAELFSKSTGITGAAGSYTTTPHTPNVTIAWATSGELSTITPSGAKSTYALRVVATRTADGKTRTFRGEISILAVT